MNDPEKTGAYQPGDADPSAASGTRPEGPVRPEMIDTCHPQLAAPAVDVAAPPLPQQIGRYRVERVLGKGGFGLVYLAHDDQLQRLVAIKVPHAKLVAQTIDAEAYLTEARTVASLDHPHIVPVHDVGSTDRFPCFVVSKYIDGTDLSTRLKQSRLSLHEAVELVATVAEALHHAHKQGLVHRDVKPGNILLDKNGTFTRVSTFSSKKNSPWQRTRLASSRKAMSLVGFLDPVGALQWGPNMVSACQSWLACFMLKASRCLWSRSSSASRSYSRMKR